MTEVANHYGYTKKGVHWKMKRKFLHPIYMTGETAANLVYQANYQALTTIHELQAHLPLAERVDIELLHKKILTLKDASKKQMGQYFEDYWPFINSRGIQLTDPDSFLGDFRGEINRIEK